MSYEQLDSIADLDWSKIDLASPTEFENMLTGHLNNIEVYDPEVGSTFFVESLEVLSNKVCALLPNDVVVEMNLATEYRCLVDSLFEESVTFKNRKDFLKYLIDNKKEINESVKNQNIKLEITRARNGILEGSISLWNSKNLADQFLEQIRYNKVIESGKKKYTKSRNAVYSPQEVHSHDEIVNAKTQQRYYRCKLVEMNKGGFMGYISGVQVFVPGSLAHHKKIDNYADFVGDTINVMIDSYVRDRKIFIASHKRYIDAKIPGIVEELDNNEKITGTITGLTKYGIFISFKEFLNGLMHISEMSQTSIDKLQNGEFTIGDSIDFYVKSHSDGKIVLSEISLEDAESEWTSMEEDLIGSVVLAKAIKKISAGFLFQLENGQRGLLYDVEAKKYPMRIELDQEFEVEVWKMDFESSKIFLKYPEIQNLQELGNDFIPR